MTSPSSTAPPASTPEIRVHESSSITTQYPAPSHVENPNSNRKLKYDTKWKQQKNPAIRREFTFLRILIFFMILGVFLILLGAISYSLSSKYPEAKRYDYTNCMGNKTLNITEAETEANITTSTTPTEVTTISQQDNEPPIQCSSFTPTEKETGCKCSVEIDISEELANSKKVFFFYELENFLQNTRKYKKDVDWDQCEGKVFDKENKPIKPVKCSKELKKDGKSNQYTYPCGVIANSYFTDEFKMFNEAGKEVTLNPAGIAWTSDKAKRFKNPAKWDDVQKHFILPEAWPNATRTSFMTGNSKGVENERFIVWMRSASFNVFRKKYAYVKGLKKGKYRVEIDYRYDVKSFHGKKSIVIAADSATLPVNNAFFYGFISLGAICLLLGPLFFSVQILIKIVHKTRMSRRSNVSSPEEIPKGTDESHRHEHAAEDKPPATPSFFQSLFGYPKNYM